MPVKIFIALVALVGVAIGFALPTPRHPEPAPVSQIQTIELGD